MVFSLKYLSLGIGDPQKLNGCLENLAAKLILKRVAVNIFRSDGLNWGLLDIHKGQDLPVNIHKHYINLHCDILC